MATVQKFNQFSEDLLKGDGDYTSDASCTVMVALSNVAPVATNSILANITEIAYTNLSGNPGSRVVTAITGEQSSGTAALGSTGAGLVNTTLSASGGAIAAFRYLIFYNDGATSSIGANPLIGWLDYGSSLTLLDGESLTLVYGASGILTIT